MVANKTCIEMQDPKVKPIKCRNGFFSGYRRKSFLAPNLFGNLWIKYDQCNMNHAAFLHHQKPTISYQTPDLIWLKTVRPVQFASEYVAHELTEVAIHYTIVVIFIASVITAYLTNVAIVQHLSNTRLQTTTNQIHHCKTATGHIVHGGSIVLMSFVVAISIIFPLPYAIRAIPTCFMAGMWCTKFFTRNLPASVKIHHAVALTAFPLSVASGLVDLNNQLVFLFLPHALKFFALANERLGGNATINTTLSNASSKLWLPLCVYHPMACVFVNARDAMSLNGGTLHWPCLTFIMVLLFSSF